MGSFDNMNLSASKHHLHKYNLSNTIRWAKNSCLPLISDVATGLVTMVPQSSIYKASLHDFNFTILAGFSPNVDYSFRHGFYTELAMQASKNKYQ